MRGFFIAFFEIFEIMRFPFREIATGCQQIIIWRSISEVCCVNYRSFPALL